MEKGRRKSRYLGRVGKVQGREYEKVARAIGFLQSWREIFLSDSSFLYSYLILL